jgi:hypothetical protein
MATPSTNVEETSMTVTLVNGLLHFEGFIYIRSQKSKGRVYWDCRKVRSGECKGRAITTEPNEDQEVVVLKGPKESPHTHPPNREEAAADVVKEKIKRKAEDHPEQPPAQLLRTELAGVPAGVLSQLPDQPALTQAIRRTRRRHLPPNPTSLSHLHELPDRFTKTLLDENFVLYDSGAPDVDDDDDESGNEESRIIVFGMRRNVELLCQSSVWFLDGTFKTAPNIFVQIFTILGLRSRAGRPDETTAFPFVYAFLPSKTSDAYKAVLASVCDAVAQYNVRQCNPQRIITDFELSIINACREIYPQVPVSCCFFHMGQSLYRRIQEIGLQVMYNDPNDRSIKEYAHMMLSLAFVPLRDVTNVFNELRDICPDEMRPMIEYFETNYIRGKAPQAPQTRNRGRGVTGRGGTRPAVPRLARFPPDLWNHYDAASNKQHRTNNCAEGWHNRFRLIVGKHHPDLYSCITELQKEQSYTEASVAEMALGKKTKAAPKRQWVMLQERIQDIVQDYDTYKNAGTTMDYLRTLGYNVALS